MAIGTPVTLGELGTTSSSDPLEVTCGTAAAAGSAIYVACVSNNNSSSYCDGVTSDFTTNGWTHVGDAGRGDGGFSLYLSVWRAEMVSGSGNVDLTFTNSAYRRCIQVIEIPGANETPVQDDSFNGDVGATATDVTATFSSTATSGNMNLSFVAEREWITLTADADGTTHESTSNDQLSLWSGYISSIADDDFTWQDMKERYVGWIIELEASGGGGASFTPKIITY